MLLLNKKELDEIANLLKAKNPELVHKGVLTLESYAKAGYADAQFELGGCYHTGNAVKKDEQKAARYYKLAADQGHVDAQLELGWRYALGKGVERNLVKAIACHEKGGINTTNLKRKLQTEQKAVLEHVLQETADMRNIPQQIKEVVISKAQEEYNVDPSNKKQLAQFTATVKKIFTQYQNKDIEDNIDEAVAAIKKSPAFSALDEREKISLPQIVGEVNAHINPVGSIVAEYLGAAPKEIDNPASFHFDQTQKRFLTKIDLDKENSLQIQFLSKGARDAFAQDVGNKHILEGLQEKGAKVDTKYSELFGGYSVMIKLPRNANPSAREQVAQLKPKLRPLAAELATPRHERGRGG
jgi:hypothetical protein